MKTIALDMASATGVHWSDGREHFVTTWQLRGTLGQKANQLTRNLRQLIEDKGCSLIGYEHSAYGAKFAATREFHGILRGALLTVADELDIEAWPYNITTVKSCTAGNGHAKKWQMIRAVKLRFGIECADDNQADAVGIGMMMQADPIIRPTGMVKRRLKSRLQKQRKREKFLF